MEDSTKLIVGGLAVAGVAYLYFSPSASAEAKHEASPGLLPPANSPPAGANSLQDAAAKKETDAAKQVKAAYDALGPAVNASLASLGSFWGLSIATHPSIAAQLVPRPFPAQGTYSAPQVPPLPPIVQRSDYQAVSFLGLPNSRIFAAWDVYGNYAEEFAAGSTLLIISPSENAELKSTGQPGTIFYAPGRGSAMCRFYTTVDLSPYLKTL